MEGITFEIMSEEYGIKHSNKYGDFMEISKRVLIEFIGAVRWRAMSDGARDSPSCHCCSQCSRGTCLWAVARGIRFCGMFCTLLHELSKKTHCHARIARVSMALCFLIWATCKKNYNTNHIPWAAAYLPLSSGLFGRASAPIPAILILSHTQFWLPVLHQLESRSDQSADLKLASGELWWASLPLVS